MECTPPHVVPPWTQHTPPRTFYVDYSKSHTPVRGPGPIQESLHLTQRPDRRSSTAPLPPTKKAKFAQDTLGKIVTESVKRYLSFTSWEDYVAATRGSGHLNPAADDLDHPAVPFLRRLRRKGMPVLTRSSAWTPDDLHTRLARGSHQSVDAHIDFVRDEMADFASKAFWTVLPFDLVKHLPGLRLSPLGCVPQRGRRPRLIVDLTFYGVNDDTIKLAPADAMQFGRALERLLFRVRHANPRFGPTYLSKIDISDGFYRVWLAAATAVKLAVVIPSLPGEPSLVAIPLSLPMGWVESPPTFCAATETVADITNRRAYRCSAPPHRLEAYADTPPPPVDPDPVLDHTLEPVRSLPHRNTPVTHP